MANQSEKQSYILGLDIGSSSLGWAVLETNKTNKPTGVLACGVRVFPAGVEGLETGKDTSPNADRRQKRQIRRQLMRKARRMRKLFRILMLNGLLPTVEKVTPEAIDTALKQLDQELAKKWITKGDTESHLAFPYRLRAAAAKSPLELFELGRALYHLVHRRGFLSNRKSVRKDDEELGKVHSGIETLKGAMEEAKCATLGAYFSSIASHEVRLRSRWTSRQMYLDEFAAIQKANPQVPELVWKEIHKAAFFQRKLKSQAHLIGKCSLVKDRPRAPLWHPEYQRFRILSAVNALRVADDSITDGNRFLDVEERAELIEALKNQQSMTAGGVKRLLKLPKSSTLSIDETGSGDMIGDRTAATMRKAFGDRWNALTHPEQLEALHDVNSFEKDDALGRRGQKHWKLSAEQAKEFSKIVLEPGYGSVSVAAIIRLMPHLEKGMTYAEARKKEFPEQFEKTDVMEFLPPVKDFKDAMRNPAVARSLSELRLVVNSLIRKFGKPAQIRVELARDLKKPKKQREQISKDNRSREKTRETHAAEIVAKTSLKQPSRADIEKFELWKECRGICPYTGRSINMSDLFGSTPQVDVEHIVPFSRSCDNSFANKTLCFSEENRNVKQKKTPFEAYGSSPRWGDMIARVKRLDGSAAKAKLARFLNESSAQDMAEQFSTRQLNDTRYASVLARQYLSQLYGGFSDEDGKSRVQATAGQTTAFLRREWRLNLLLNDKDQKSRKDHRHHTIDATVIALTSPRQIKALTDAASRATGAKGQRLFAPIEEPWTKFFEQIQAAIDPIVVSHRVRKSLSGALHEETNYRAPMASDPTSSFVRKPLAALSKTELEGIVDPKLRDLIMKAVGKGDPKKVFQEQKSLPTIIGSDGIVRRVRRVRVKANRPTMTVGSGLNRRFVSSGGNHHMAIYETATNNGLKWNHKIVTRLQATQRNRSGLSVVDRAVPDNTNFIFSLCPGECIAIPRPTGEVDVFVVRGCTAALGVEVVLVADARTSGEIRDKATGGKRIFYSAETLRKLNASKVVVSPIGQVFGAGG